LGSTSTKHPEEGARIHIDSPIFTIVFPENNWDAAIRVTLGLFNGLSYPRLANLDLNPKHRHVFDICLASAS
jgi:hypothetical protein|tara:strand:- start:1041 stop:1256 length:216 start_codon:yes stop_codon:yes gene_type:complete